jgi:hypothetical protein
MHRCIVIIHPKIQVLRYLLLVLDPLHKKIKMHLAIVIGFGNAEGSHGPLAWQGQMAALTLPYGKPDRIGS